MMKVFYFVFLYSFCGGKELTGSKVNEKASPSGYGPCGDDDDAQSMNDILSQSASSSFDCDGNAAISAVANKNKKRDSKKKGKNKFSIGKRRGKATDAGVLEEKLSSDSSILSQLTYVEGRSSIMGTGLGYRVSATINETADMSKKAEPKTSSSVLI